MVARISRFLAARPHLLPCLATAVLLIYITDRRPYAFYELARWTVLLSGALTAWVAWQSKGYWATWLLVVICVTFNPLAPIHLRRTQWQPIDLATAAVFAVGAVIIRRSADPGSTVAEPA